MTVEAPDLSRIDFPCANCGALQRYAPGTDQLRCPYCGYEIDIPRSTAEVLEYDLGEALEKLRQAQDAGDLPEQADIVHCEACAASFTFDQDIHSGECPYCGTPVVLGTEFKSFRPKSLLPFSIDERQAKDRFREWIGSRWFAPGGLKKYARDETKLRGIYVPYWTYDSDTTTHYEGERGDHYQVPVQYTTIVKGRSVTRTRMVTKIRWTRVDGSVSRFFDDILVGASQSLPRRITDALEPWDIDQLTPYQEQYLSGFSSQVYQVEIDEGFERARQIMAQVIRQDMSRDIGGDAQRIHRMQTRHRNTVFKHLLLPVWTAGFRYRDREYIFVVNGRTGKVKGERPYSKWKVFLTVAAGVLVVGILVLYGQGYIE